MSLLFPLYLLGALAVAIPIVLHLRRRPARDRIEFSSTLFLDPQEPPHRRSSRIEHWLLLALRCAALLLLALLFSRPLWRGAVDAAPPGGSVRLILIDRSASMRQTGAWEQALAEARKLAASAQPGDRLGLGAFDRDLELLVPFGTAPDARTAIEAALHALTPGWGDTAFDEALLSAAGLVEEEARGHRMEREVFLISDFPESASRDRLQTSAWPAEVHLRGIRVPATADPPPINASIQVVAAAEDDETAANRTTESIRLRVTRSGGGNEDAVVTVRWKDQAASALQVRLPPGASRVLTAPPRPHPEATELELSGDAEAFDNRAFVAPRRARTVRVLFAGESIDPANAESPLFFLSRSLGPTESLRPEISARLLGELTAADWRNADVALLSGNLPVGQVPELRGFVEGGGLAIVLLSDAGAGGWLAKLDPGFAVSEAEVEDYSLLEGIDFDHAIFRPFATPGLRDFSKIHTWKHRRLTLPAAARVLARFDSQDPALAEWPAGEGRIVLSAMNWVPAESQLPLSSKFVPLMFAILGEAGFQHREADRYLAGDELPGTARPPVRLGAPGIYAIPEGAGERKIACNLPPGESRLERFPVESLAAFGIPIGTAKAVASDDSGTAGPRLQAADLEGQQRLWKWLLPALLAVLLVETWWANRPRLKPVMAR